MKNELLTRAPYYLRIRTNEYTGNFERELCGYVFGYLDEETTTAYDPDCYCIEFYEEDLKGNPLVRETLKDKFLYIESKEHGWQQYWDITSHPDNNKWNCDSIIIQLQEPLCKTDIIVFDYERFVIDRIKKYFKDERIPNKNHTSIPDCKAYDTPWGANLISIELIDTRTDKVLKKYEVD